MRVCSEPAGAETTNCVWLRPRGPAAAFKARCRAAGLVLGDVEGDRVLPRVNPTILARTPDAIVRTLVEVDALAGI